MNLVTGATGILGSHVVLNLLKRGEKVVACKQNTSSLKPIEKLLALNLVDWKSSFDQIKWLDLDIRDNFAIEEALEGIKNLYHCAAIVSFNPKLRKKMFEVNETGTRNIVNACLMNPTVRLCHVSSIATINNSDYNFDLNEEVFWKKSGKESDYALSKYNAEGEVWRGMEEGLKAFIVNPGIIISPVLWKQSSNRLFHMAIKGNRYYTGGSGAYVAVGDVAEIMIRLMEKQQFGERYIIIENNYYFKDILSVLQSVFHPKLKLKPVSKNTLRFVSMFENLFARFRSKDPVLTKALIHAAFNKQKYSGEKVMKTINYKFIPVNEYITRVCEQHLKGGVT